MPRRANSIGCVAQRDLIDKLQHPRHTETRVPAHRHGGGAGVGVPALNRQLHPAEALAVGDDADLDALGL